MGKNWPYSTYSKIDLKVKETFPFEKPRSQQLETISEIKEAIDKGYKYIVLEAGTGTGKSVIAATLASMYGSSYILTITKQLQDQYQRDFKNLGFNVVKGRGNFKCKKYSEDNIKQHCDEGRCVIEGYNCEYSIKRKSPETIKKESTCEYEYQKWVAINSEVVISNYPYMFLELNYNQDFKKRKLIVCDEAHNLENTIMNQLKLEFNRKELKEYGVNLSKEVVNKLNNGNYTDWIDFIKKIRDNYSKELDNLKKVKKTNISEKKSFLNKRITDCDRFIKHIKFDPQKWIFDYDSFYGVCEFKPIQVENYAENNLFEYADTCLFMSATILDYKLFAKWLGIKDDEIYAIRRKSPFKVNQNPIKTFSEFNMSYNSLSKSAPDSIDTIKKILEIHKHDKGIIHTISHQCKDYLKKKLDDDRLIDHKTYNRAKQLKKFKNSEKPLVLISPSMNEGVDLPGSLCRFQIIYKIPYPSLADKQTRLRKNIDKQWYDYKTALSLVQTYGRGMRYENDYCKTYFIDNRLKGFVRLDEIINNFLPENFKEAIDITPAEINETEDLDFNEDNLINLEEETENNIIKYDVINEKNTIPKDEKIKVDDNLSYTQKVNLKYELTLKGQELIDNEEYEQAIEFYKDLLNHELFINDYHPYRKLSRAYRAINRYDDEVELLVKFFSSGIYCRNSKLKWFKERLKELSDYGYFDYSRIGYLELEYDNNGAKNRKLSSKPVPTAVKIRKAKQNNDKPKLEYNKNYFDSLISFDENLSYNKKIDFKYELYNLGRSFIDSKQYDKAIGFYNSLLTHELFKNDYHPYLKLSQIYRKDKQYENEVKLLIRFFKSGIYCNKKQFNWFKRRLKQLYKYGFYDFSRFNHLEAEFNKKGAKNILSSNKPVPIVAEIKKYKLNSENEMILNDFDDFYDSIAHVDENMSYDEKIKVKSKLVNLGNQYIDNKQYELAIKFYNRLLTHELFVNDYHPYRKLSRIYRKDKQYENEVNIIVKFYKSGIYCSEKQLNWFKKRLKQLSKYDNFDFSKIDELESEFYRNSFNNKDLVNTPVPIAINLKKNTLSLEYKKPEDNHYSINYSVNYFNNLANEIAQMPGYISDRELSNHSPDDFVLFDNFNDVDKKAELIKKGKELEKDDYIDAIDFYDDLKTNPLFINDYYPYRRQCIIFKNKLKNNRRDWNTILEFFSSGIYCNNHQYIWLKNKILELIPKLSLSNSEINQMEDLINDFDKHRGEYEKLQNIPVPIAERIYKDEEGLKVVSQEKYDYVQNVYYIKELGVGYIRRGEYEKAMRYYSDLLNSDVLYYRYHAYKQFARIFKEMGNLNRFKIMYENFVR